MPAEAQLAHEGSHATHCPFVESKNSFGAQVETHEDDEARKTGRDEGQVRHVVGVSEQVAQSGWQGRQVAAVAFDEEGRSGEWNEGEEKKPDGQEGPVMQVPFRTRAVEEAQEVQ